MSYIPTGKHLIAGEWIASDATFKSEPATGPAHDYSVGTEIHVDAAEAAFWSYGCSERSARAVFLNAIADELEARADAVTEIGVQP